MKSSQVDKITTEVLCYNNASYNPVMVGKASLEEGKVPYEMEGI